MHEGAVSAELGLEGYPSIAESVMVGRDLAIARYEGAPLHICHVSAAESVAEIRRARELGLTHRRGISMYLNEATTET